MNTRVQNVTTLWLSIVCNKTSKSNSVNKNKCSYPQGHPAFGLLSNMSCFQTATQVYRILSDDINGIPSGEKLSSYILWKYYENIALYMVTVLKIVHCPDEVSRIIY